MPGMMDTVLNVGINNSTARLLAAECGSDEFARDTHRRFLDVYSRVVLNASPKTLEQIEDPALWRDVLAKAGSQLPEDVWLQLNTAVRAVFHSWNSKRAQRYRAHHGICGNTGTAVLVQAMVFGNRDDRSGTGVLFTRNPLSGEPEPYGEFLLRAQGEDVVSGKITPQPIEAMRPGLGVALDRLLAAARLLERSESDMQDIEFTVQSGELFLLQTRNGKRAPEAAARIAVDMVAEGMITTEVGLSRVSPEQIRSCLRPRLAEDASIDQDILQQGEGASPGVGWGVVVTDPDEAERRAHRGEDVVLARVATSPDDLHGMIAARAIITEYGGATSHAAVVGRALGRPCVVGCGEGIAAALAGRRVTVDGGAGIIYPGELEVTTPDEGNDPVLQRLSKLAAASAPLEILADTCDTAVHVDADLSLISDLVALRDALSCLAPGATVRGPFFAQNNEAVAAAVEAGVAKIITHPRLPALLASIRCAGAKLLVAD